MAIVVKIERFQIKSNVLDLKSTLIFIKTIISIYNSALCFICETFWETLWWCIFLEMINHGIYHSGIQNVLMKNDGKIFVKIFMVKTWVTSFKIIKNLYQIWNKNKKNLSFFVNLTFRIFLLIMQKWRQIPLTKYV